MPWIALRAPVTKLEAGGSNPSGVPIYSSKRRPFDGRFCCLQPTIVQTLRVCKANRVFWFMLARCQQSASLASTTIVKSAEFVHYIPLPKALYSRRLP